MTGNTHRAEICIDKLYSPDGPTGRLGLVEFRAFEMPPDARMSLAQQLLLRALVAWFWREPQRGALVRWGTGAARPLHAAAFRLGGFPRRARRPRRRRLRFRAGMVRGAARVPLSRSIGRVDHGGVELELRQALEPWHVLGEEGAAGGTVRYVDSSVERLQVKANGLRRRPPCRRPATAARCRCSRPGVRARRWRACASRPGSRPPACTRPSPPHAPLTFDIVDTWNGRSLGGCVYHVAHPGGRNYETFPVNSYEAEARRLARFQDHGHTPGAAPVPPRRVGERIPADAGPAEAHCPLSARSVATHDDDALARVAAWTRGYAPLPGMPDEFIGADGARAPHWPRLLQALAALEPGEIAQRFAAADRRIRDSGMSYRVHGETAERVWPLEPLPLLIAEAEWREIAHGVAQRAELLERVLPTSTARAGWSPRASLPAAALTGSTDFIAAMRGVKPPGGRWLSSTPPTSAAAPTGAGGCSATAPRRPRARATRWRTAWCSRAPFPASTAQMNVERLAPFFRDFRAGLEGERRRAPSRASAS